MPAEQEHGPQVLHGEGEPELSGKAGLTPADIDGVVSVSTTGIATPSLEARVGPRLGLRPDVRRVPLFGLGCAGGVSGLATTARLAMAEPGSRWLFVTVETCSISIRLDSDDPAAVATTALFADGAAAAVVQCGEHGAIRIAGSAEKLWPDTLRIMGWDIEDPGLAVVFDRSIPPFLERELAANRGTSIEKRIQKLARSAALARVGGGRPADARLRVGRLRQLPEAPGPDNRVEEDAR